MQPIVTHVAWSVSLCVGLPHHERDRWTTSVSPAKRLDWSRCSLRCRLMGSKEPCISWRGPDPTTQKRRCTIFWGSNTWAYPDLTAVHILNLIRKGAAAMRPLATSTVATCLVVALALDVSGSSQSVTDNNGWTGARAERRGHSIPRLVASTAAPPRPLPATATSALATASLVSPPPTDARVHVQRRSPPTSAYPVVAFALSNASAHKSACALSTSS